MIEGSIIHGDTTIQISMHLKTEYQKIRQAKTVRFEKKIHQSTTIIRNSNTPLSVIDRSAGRKSVRIQLI